METHLSSNLLLASPITRDFKCSPEGGVVAKSRLPLGHAALDEDVETDLRQVWIKLLGCDAWVRVDLSIYHIFMVINHSTRARARVFQVAAPAAT